MFEKLHPFALALILGFLIGVEREYHDQTAQKTLGVRTFALVALTGALAAWIKTPPLAAVLAGAVFALVLMGYWRQTAGKGRNADPGLTTEVAALITFAMGYVLVNDVRLGVVLGLTTLALLISRDWLHRFVREKLRQQELSAAAILVILFFGISPFLPDHAVDPLGMINPRHLLMLFTLIALLQFTGYAAGRLFGARVGLALSGFLGGLVSSTAVFVGLAQTRRDNIKYEKSVIAHALFALAATLVELGLVIVLANTQLAVQLALPLLVMLSSCSAIAFLLARGEPGHRGSVRVRDPVNFRSVLKLALLLAGLIALVNLAHRLFQDRGLWLVAGISGLFELQGVCLAIALDLQRGAIPMASGTIAILLAIAASFVSKIGIILFTHRDSFGLKVAAILLVVLGAGFGAALLPPAFF